MKFDLSQVKLEHRYMLYGPPGVGKTTTIKWLKRAGFKAIDLEDYPASEWEHVIEHTDAQFIGAAGVHPTQVLPDHVYKVLLWVKQGRYDQRRSRRDKNEPCKADQRKHTIQEWKSFEWDLAINTGYGDYETWQSMLYKFLNSISEFEAKYSR